MGHFTEGGLDGIVAGIWYLKGVCVGVWYAVRLWMQTFFDA